MKFTKNKHAWKFGGLAAANGLLFGLTNASSASSFVLIAGLILLVVTFYYLVNALLNFVRLYGLSIKRKKRLALYITGFLAGLVALQSIGELNTRDVMVLVPLAFIGYAYSFYAKNNQRSPVTT